MQLLSIVLPEFSKNPEAAFNFIDVAFRDRPLPCDYLGQMIDFFIKIHRFAQWHYYGLHKDPFEIATEALSARLLDSFTHHMVRSKIPLSSIPESLQNDVHHIETAIQQRLRCTATTSQFTKVGQVHCENSLQGHGNVHQSSKTWVESIPFQGIFGRIFGLSTTTTKACWWQGEFELPAKYTPGWLYERSIPNTSFPKVSVTFLAAHKKLLVSQQKMLEKVNSFWLCLGCLLNVPTEELVCRHRLCIQCCSELQSFNTIECPFCNVVGLWNSVDIPKGAGYRILAIEGGVQGIISAVLLEQIEQHTGIFIHQLFDLIIGTSCAGLNALGFGVSKVGGKEMVALFQKLSLQAFCQPDDIIESLLSFLNGFKYSRKHKHAALSSQFHSEPMLGSVQLPRVAVVACDTSSGKPKPILFTSYNTSNTTFKRVIDKSLLDVAEATTAAGTYFWVCISLNNKKVKMN